MISLQKTASSNFCFKFFNENSGKGLNFIHDNYLFFKKFVEESYSSESKQNATSKFDKFKQDLKNLDLKLVYFCFHFDEKNSKYGYQYVIRSKKHNNPDFKVEGLINDTAIPFGFFPCMFADWMADILDQVPMAELRLVSMGK